MQTTPPQLWRIVWFVMLVGTIASGTVAQLSGSELGVLVNQCTGSECNTESSQPKRNRLRLMTRSFLFGLPLLLGFLVTGSDGAGMVKADLQTLINECTSTSEVTVARRTSCLSLQLADTSTISDMSFLFLDAYYTDLVNISKWNVSNVTDMTQMFERSTFNSDISKWDVSSVITMSRTFRDSSYNGDISEWNVAAVTGMDGMFEKGAAFNGDISNWDVSALKTMQNMFALGSEFNGNISEWNVSAVTDMGSLFYQSAFNGDISKWDVSAVADMSQLFGDKCVTFVPYTCTGFNGDISRWDVSAVTTMSSMFAKTSFTGNISNWNTAKVADFSGMFRACGGDATNIRCTSVFNSDLSRWDTSSATSMSRMFYYSSSFNGAIPNWNTAKVTDTSEMFKLSLFNGNISNWDVSAVTTTRGMFQGGMFEGAATGSIQFRPNPFNGDITKWNVAAVADTRNMFRLSLFNGDISAWDVSAVTTMSFMLAGDLNFNTYNDVLSSFNGNISKWDVSRVTDMSYTFTSSSFNGDISKWNVSTVITTRGMFYKCSFNRDISRWDVSAVRDMRQMLSGGFQSSWTSRFNGDISKWDVSAVTQMGDLFAYSNFNSDISKWNVAAVYDMSRMFFSNTAFDRSLCSWNNSIATSIDVSGMFGDGNPKTGLCCSGAGYADSTSACVSCPANAVCAGDPAQPVCNDPLALRADGNGFICGACENRRQFSPKKSGRLTCLSDSAPFNVANCQFNKTWEQLTDEYGWGEGPNSDIVTGGLGLLMVEDVFEVWVCLRDHQCLANPGVSATAGDFMCFAYNEDLGVFFPWGKQSDLNLF